MAYKWQTWLLGSYLATTGPITWAAEAAGVLGFLLASAVCFCPWEWSSVVWCWGSQEHLYSVVPQVSIQEGEAGAMPLMGALTHSPGAAWLGNASPHVHAWGLQPGGPMVPTSVAPMVCGH